MTLAPLAARVVALAGTRLFAFPAEHGGIQIQRESHCAGHLTRSRSQRQSGRQKDSMCAWEKRRKKLRIVSSLGKRSSPRNAWSTWSARNHSQWAKRRAPHDGHEERGEGVRQRDGVVGRGLGEGLMPLDRRREANLPQEGNETGQPAEGRDGLGVFLQNQLGIAKERGDFGAGRFVRGRAGLFKHQSLCPQPFPQCDPFSISEFGFSPCFIRGSTAWLPAQAALKFTCSAAGATSRAFACATVFATVRPYLLRR